MLRQLELWFDHVGLVNAHTTSALDRLEARLNNRVPPDCFTEVGRGCIGLGENER